jgi:hemoglobin
MNAPAPSTRCKPDIDSREQVERFVRVFYARLLRDPQLGPIFLDVAEVDLAVHLPHIVDYWSKLLLGERGYRRHTMNIHRRLHGKQELRREDFERWLDHFRIAVDDGWEGPGAERARRIATAIAGNMVTALNITD